MTGPKRDWTALAFGILRLAVRTEFRTVQGVINWGSLVLAAVLTVAWLVHGVFENVTLIVAAAASGQKIDLPDFSVIELIWSFFGFGALCVILVTSIEWFKSHTAP